MAVPYKILGIDPGTNLLGYAILEIPARGKPLISCYGRLDLRAYKKQAPKLRQIFQELQHLIRQHQPTEAAIEAPFFGKDVQAMLKLGRAQGAAMLVAALEGLVVEEYSPRSIKKAVTGKGSASKQQVAGMLPHLIQGELQDISLDASDAIGAAYCHYLQKRQGSTGQKRYKDWKSFLKENPKRKS